MGCELGKNQVSGFSINKKMIKFFKRINKEGRVRYKVHRDRKKKRILIYVVL